MNYIFHNLYPFNLIYPMYLLNYDMYLLNEYYNT